jgi:hypothetical protein
MIVILWEVDEWAEEVIIKQTITIMSLFNLDKPNKKHPYVETAYKFVTYYVVGFGIISLVPYTHFLLGLGRSAY